MFSVLFEVHPKHSQWDGYLGIAKMLKPEIEKIDGFIDNTRYRSLRRDGWLLSLSTWRDEKALVRWRTQATHHRAQEQGRSTIMNDYHLRVGELTGDTRLPEGHAIHQQRLDETETGAAKAVVLIDAQRRPEWVAESKALDVARWLGLTTDAAGLVAWDVFNAVLTPGDIILLTSWQASSDAKAAISSIAAPEGARVRTVRIVRDYGMFDRHEAPQYYPEVARV